MAKKIFAFIMAAALAFTALAGCTAQKDADTAKENITTTKKVTDDSNFKLSYTQADSLDPFKSKTCLILQQNMNFPTAKRLR